MGISAADSQGRKRARRQERDMQKAGRPPVWQIRSCTKPKKLRGLGSCAALRRGAVGGKRSLRVKCRDHVWGVRHGGGWGSFIGGVFWHMGWASGYDSGASGVGAAARYLGL